MEIIKKSKNKYLIKQSGLITRYIVFYSKNGCKYPCDLSFKYGFAYHRKDLKEAEKIFKHLNVYLGKYNLNQIDFIITSRNERYYSLGRIKEAFEHKYKCKIQRSQIDYVFKKYKTHVQTDRNDIRKHDKRNLKQLHRRKKIMHYKRLKLTDKEIAKKFGIHRVTVNRLLNSFMK